MVLLGNSSNSAVSPEGLLIRAQLLARQLITTVVEIELATGCTCAQGGPKEVSIVLIVRRGEEATNDFDVQTKHNDDCACFDPSTEEVIVD